MADIALRIKSSTESVAFSIGESYGTSAPDYDGPYTVTPLAWSEVVLDTDGMRMEQDVTVLEIPYLETSNEAGGVTVSIAS